MTGGGNAPSSIERLNALIARLIEPASSIQDPTQRREARLLASLLMALVIIGVIAEAVPLIADPGIRQEVQANPFGTALSVTVIVTLAALFFLSRTPRYRLAAALTVVVCWLGIFTFAVRGQSASDFYFLVYLILPVLFASIFFSLRMTFLVIAVSTAGMAFLPILNARADPFEIPLLFFFAVSCLTVIAARHRNLVERDRQAQLVAGELRYQSITELTSDFAYAFRVEPDGTVWLDWITGAVTPITGYQPDDIDQKIDLARITHPDDRPIATKHLETLLSGQAGVSEFRIIARSGAVRWIRAYGKPIWDKSQGRVVSVYGAVQDITGEKHAQEALKQAHNQLERRVAERTAALLEANDVLTVEIEERKRVEERLAEERNLLRTLIDNLPDDIFVKDQEGRFLVANNALARRLGQEKADALIGKTDYDLYPRERADAFRADEQKLLQSGEAIVNKEIAAKAPDGSTIWHATTKVPLRDARGDIVGLVGITRDITDQKQIEAALREAQNDLERHVAARTAELTRANAQLQQEIAERMRAENAEREQRVMAEALRDTAAILNATLDFNEVLERILTNVEQVVPHDAASITLVDNGVARVVRERGYAENGVKADMLRFPIEETATLKTMVATQQPLVIPDVQNYDDWVDVPDERWIRAYAGAPIFLEGKLIGFLNLNSGAPNTFNETHAERLQAFADQAALAIKNARLYQAEHGQRALAEALRDSAAALSATLDYDEVLDRILTNVGRVVPHDAANIMLIDGDVVRMVRCHGFAAFGFTDEEVLSVRFPINKIANMRQMLETRKPVVIPDVRDYPDWVTYPITEWVRSNATAPILLEGAVIGFLDLNSAAPNAFSSTDAERLQAFAEQAALAIKNARLYIAEQEQRVLAEALRDTAAALNATLDFNEVIERILTNVGRVVPHDAANVMLIESGVAQVVREHGYSPKGVDAALLRFPVDRTATLRRMAESRRPLVISDVERCEEWVSVPEEHWIRSYAGAPIFIRSYAGAPMFFQERLIGFLSLDSATPGAFSDIDGERLQAFADQAAIAIENAHLYGESQDRNRQLALLNQITRVSTATLDISLLLQGLADTAADIIGGDGCFITLWDAESRRVLPGAAYGELRDVYAHVSPEPGERTLTEAALNAGHPIAVEDILSKSYLSADVVPLYPMRSVLALPLRADGRNLGAVLIGFNERHHFSPTEVAWAEQAADLIALAIAKAQAYTGLEQRVERLELLNQITRVSTTAQNVTDLVESLVNFAARIIGGDSCYISLWDADNQCIVPGAAYGPLRESFRHTPSRPGEPSLTEEVLASGQPLAVSDPDEVPHLRDRIAQVFGARSMLALPLLADGRKLGALIIGFHQPHVFTNAEVTWAEQAADLIALAIAKAQAYAELEQRVEQRTAELRAANERLQALSNIKDEFVSNVSHELRTPIASLKLYHDLLARNPAHQDRYVTRLERETDRLERIIEDLLYLSRMEQGQVELAPEPVALNALAEQYALDRAPLAENHKLHLALETQDGLPPVLADSRLLEQALSTLLTNALSYTPPGGTVTILTRSAERNGGQWVGIGIKDTGPGIPEAERMRLFERFFRGKAAIESGTPGTGLGLSIAHEIVERHGGEMEVQSDGVPGAGATFLIWLPALDGR